MEIRATLIALMIRTGSLLYDRKYVVATDGNISVRLPSGNLLITASGESLGRLTETSFVEVTSAGEIAGDGLPSSELPVHLITYELRRDVSAVIHAHPPHVVALSLAGIQIRAELVPEVLMSLGEIRETEFAAPSSEASANSVAKLIKNSNCIVMKRHGSLTVGKSLEEAFDRLERLEYTARLTYLCQNLGGILPMTEDEIAAVQASAEAYNAGILKVD